MSTISNSLNGYTIQTQIGAGSEGVIFKAQKEGQLYALKQIKQIQINLDIIDMIIAESQYFSNIVKHYEWFEHNNLTYIVMEYGYGNLNDLRNKLNLTQIDKFIIMKEIAQGIKQFHDKKLIHRDIKMENVILVQEGRKFKPKICDLGLLKERQFNNTYKVGSPLFQAPEVDFQKSQYGQQADIWQFAMFCYELQTQKLMIEAYTHSELKDWFTQLTNDPNLVRKQLDKTIQNKQLADLIESCLKFDQNLRPNIDQVLYQLSALITTENQILRRQKIRIVQKSNSNILNNDNQQLDFIGIVHPSRSQINQQNNQLNRQDQHQENNKIKILQQQSDYERSHEIKLCKSIIIVDQPISSNQQMDQSQYIKINLLANQIIQIDKPQVQSINYDKPQIQVDNQDQQNQINPFQIEQQDESIESMYNLRSSQFIVRPSNEILQSSERMFILEKQKKILESAIKNDQIVQFIWDKSQSTTIQQYIKKNRQQLAQKIFEDLF